ncbi:MAG: nitroreductase family deazaflavin-dependent oxidoreductase, partial [Candidatus Heimdallarchaeota archaeon]|nr:nitroreductase family deazaflavin-dependent oxidoreductase [Candidatus Heimdallarchaeota archaeon]
YIASGYGTKSDWFQNIKKTPDVRIQVGMRKANAHVEFLSEDRTEEEILDYARRHPTAIKQLAKLIGYTITGEQGELKSLSKKWPVLAFYPKK